MNKLFLLMLMTVFLTVSCNKVKNTEDTSSKTENSTDKKKDTTNTTIKSEVKKYEAPNNKKVYVWNLEKEIDINKFSDWKDTDDMSYVSSGFDYFGANPSEKMHESFSIQTNEKSEYSVALIYFNGGGNKVEKRLSLEDVKIEGNNFYSTVPGSNQKEEFNGRFVKMKSPLKGESPYIYGLLMNRKGAWSFYSQSN